MNLFHFFLLAILIFSCSKNHNNEEAFVEKNLIKVKQHKKLEKNSDIYFDSVFSVASKTEIIPNDKFYISKIAKVFVTKDKFVIEDKRGEQVLVYSRKGIFEYSIGRLGSGPGEFNRINSIDVNRNNNVLILDNKNRRVSKFKLNGKFVSSYSIITPGSSILSDNSNGFYIYSPATQVKPLNENLIKHYDNKGEVDNTFCKPFFEFGLASGGMVGDSKGYIYVTQKLYYTAQKYSENGIYLLSYGSETENHCTFRLESESKLPELKELNKCTIMENFDIGNKYCLFQFNKSNNSKEFSWIDIYDIDGNILIPSIQVPKGYRFNCIGEDNLFYFVHSVENENINEVEYFIVAYKLNEIKKK